MFYCIFVSPIVWRYESSPGNGGFAEGKGFIEFVVLPFHTLQAEIRQPGGEIFHHGWQEGTDVKR